MRSDRFSTHEEIKKMLEKDSDKAGVGLFYDNGKIYTHSGESNVLVLGVPGSGKSSTFSYMTAYNILKNKESLIVVDPKAEVLNRTYELAKKNHDVYVINFRNPSKSDGVNFLREIHLMYTSEDPDLRLKGIELLNEYAMVIYPDSPSGVDPFWVESARSLFTGSCLCLFDIASEDQINLESIFSFVTEGEKRVGSNRAIDEIVESLPSDSLAKRELNGYVNAPRETRMSIYSVWSNGFRHMVQSESITDMLCSNDGLKINNLTGEKPAVIYIVLPDENKIYGKLVTIIISLITTHYIRLAEQKYNGRLPVRTHVLVEELANIAPIPNLPHLLSAGRSRNLRVYAVLQAYSQIDAVYGKDAEAIKDCFDITIAYRVNNYQTLEELSKRCGQKISCLKNYHIVEPVITPAEIGAFATRQCLVIISGRYKYITTLPFFSDIVTEYDGKIPEFKVKHRSKRPAPFDIKAVAEKYHEEKIQRIINSSSYKENDFTPPSISRLMKADDEKEKSSINVDELIKRIDEKIDELEKEMEEEKALETKGNDKNDDKRNDNFVNELRELWENDNVEFENEDK